MELGSPEFWVAIIAALGGGVFVEKAVTGVYKWLTGGHERERDALQQALGEADAEAAYRRVLQETLSETRRVAFDRGIRQEDLPPFPKRPNVGLGQDRKKETDG